VRPVPHISAPLRLCVSLSNVHEDAKHTEEYGSFRSFSDALTVVRVCRVARSACFRRSVDRNSFRSPQGERDGDCDRPRSVQPCSISRPILRNRKAVALPRFCQNIPFHNCQSIRQLCRITSADGHMSQFATRSRRFVVEMHVRVWQR